MFTSFYIFDLIYGDLTKLNALNEITGFKMDDLPNSVITLMIDDFWEICRKMDNRDRYSLKMEYSNLVKNAINRYQIKALSCSLVGTDKIIILVKSPYNFSLNDIALKIKNYNETEKKSSYKSSFLSGLTSLSNGWFLSASETSAASRFSHWMPKAGSA